MKFLRLAVTLIGLSPLAGCSSIQVHPIHTLQFEEEGRPVSPTREENVQRLDMQNGALVVNGGESTMESPRGFPIQCPEDYDIYLDNLFEALEASGKERVLIFIHGGLATANKSLERIARHIGCSDRRKESGQRSQAVPCLEEDHYPIFINWRSSLWSSWRDHLFRIRKGARASPTRAYVSSPVVAAKDLLAAAGEFLPATVELGSEIFGRSIEKDWCQEVQRVRSMDIDISLGDDCRRGAESFADKVDWMLTWPFVGVTLPALAGAGRPAWAVMYRRTNTLFESEVGLPQGCSGARGYRQHPDDPGGDGALAEFFARLELLQEERRKLDQPPLEVTLVGHSMGTIVLNKALRSFPNLEAERIVYLAAACSVDDYQDTLFPYLQRHEGTQMFHLTLHHRAEVLESRWLNAIPKGSLLVWIDGFFEDARYKLDRTAGRISNLLYELHRTPEGIRDQINVKAFAFGRHLDGHPQEHGEFDDGPFWLDSFLEPTSVEGQRCPDP